MMPIDHMLLLQTRIAKSRRISAYLKDEIAVLEELGLYSEALPKAALRLTHIRRILRYQNTLTQHRA